MNESTSTESSRSRWVTRISIALAVIAALMVIAGIAIPVVTVYVVTEKYDSLHHAARPNYVNDSLGGLKYPKRNAGNSDLISLSKVFIPMGVPIFDALSMSFQYRRGSKFRFRH